MWIAQETELIRASLTEIGQIFPYGFSASLHVKAEPSKETLSIARTGSPSKGMD
jgi:hypothetical protein